MCNAAIQQGKSQTTYFNRQNIKNINLEEHEDVVKFMVTALSSDFSQRRYAVYRSFGTKILHRKQSLFIINYFIFLFGFFIYYHSMRVSQYYEPCAIKLF